MSDHQTTTDSERCAEILQRRGVTEPLETAIVLGTGLGSIGEAVEQPLVIPYEDLPGFPAGTVSGHDGRLVVGRWEGTRVAIMQGRAHYYETGNAAAMATPLETLALLGVQIVVLTNSAGSTHLDWYPGNLAIISDHINITGINPLVGLGSDSGFVPLADAYDPKLRAKLRRSAQAANIAALREGVYMWFPGPTFETAAEIKLAKQLGADLVGMSTVPEVILARRLGLKVAAISVITNFATGIGSGNPTHAETKSTALSGSIGLKRLLRAFVRTHES